MKNLKRLLDGAIMPVLFVLLTLSAIYTEPSKSDQILLVVFAGAFCIIDIILCENHK